MKGLKRFSKNRKQKNMIIASILGVIVFIGGITLYRTFALYEEKREFNVLKGKIKDFTGESTSDLKLTFSINGDSSEGVFPTKDMNYAVNDIQCDKGVTAQWDSENWGLINIAPGNNTQIVCNIDFSKPIFVLNDVVKIGDFISMNPTTSSYTVPTNLTGYSESPQTIDPTELNLWRVLKKNSDGSLEMISEYTSSKDIFFEGGDGYKNYVKALNTIASQYENENYTTGSRHVGYVSQTDTVSLQTMSWAINWPANIPWKTNTSEHGNDYEELGGGDNYYTTDMELIEKALTKLEANKVGSTLASDYWISSRNYSYSEGIRGGATSTTLSVYYTSNAIKTASLEQHSGNSNTNYKSTKNKIGKSIRPIVMLKSGLRVTGSGSNNDPYVFVN